MLDRHGSESSADVHVQSFSVHYNYPVYFTRDLFDLKNLCLCNALSSHGPGKSQRVAIFVDEGVTLACPQVLPHILRYAAAHTDSIQIVGDLVIVPGGEAIKNQHSNVEHILRELSTRAIDRQSTSP